MSSRVARINLVLGLTNTVPAFLLSGFYASVADRYGRKLCMVLPTLGYSTYVAMLLVQAWRRSTGQRVSLAMLEVRRPAVRACACACACACARFNLTT